MAPTSVTAYLKRDSVLVVEAVMMMKSSQGWVVWGC
jgi:hypothetical protein